MGVGAGAGAGAGADVDLQSPNSTHGPFSRSYRAACIHENLRPSRVSQLWDLQDKHFNKEKSQGTFLLVNNEPNELKETQE